MLGAEPDTLVAGSESGSYQSNIQTAWETLKLPAYGYTPPNGQSFA
jgi:hypothetical protein